MQRRLVAFVTATLAAALFVGPAHSAERPGWPATTRPSTGPANDSGSRTTSSTAPRNARSRTADYARHVAELSNRLPGPGFTVVQKPPFVVIGDESPEMVQQRAEATVGWAIDRLKAQFFPKPPREILDIWLFKDRESYERFTQQLFGHAPTTPFGYFSAQDRALVMNIATGGGTLVHELVHPLMAANFPQCPAWFNEGMGSLFEQSTEMDGKIRGLTNWRLQGLQQAIRHDRIPSFQKLCATTDAEFYGDDRGTCYAQARYLCYYLQEHDLLEKFYRQFHDHVARDPTGYQTLKSVLGREDMDAFQEQWESYVLRLHFP